MIPFLTGPKFWLKVGGIAAVVAVLGFGVAKYNYHHARSVRLGEVEQQMVALKASQAASHKASEGYQNELKTIRDRPVSNAPVRLCVKPRPTVPATGSGPSATVPAPGVVSGADGTDSEVRGGPNIGPALRSLARRADEVAAQGRSTQSLHK
jgi:hypothetical protein